MSTTGNLLQRRHLLFSLGAASVLAGQSQAAAIKRASPDYYSLFIGLITAWQKHDVDAVVAHLADDIVWYAFVGSAPIKGKAAIREALTAMAPRRTAEHWRIFNHATSGNRLYADGVDDFADESGHRIAVPYMGIVEFRGELIVGWRDYFDAGLLKRMQNGEPVPAEIEPLVSRPGEP
jgi:limonene-1,2-epoxide hydrolase